LWFKIETNHIFFFLLPSSHKLRYYLTVLENYILELHKQ